MRKIRGIGVLAAVLALGLGTAWALGTAGTFDTYFDGDGVVHGGPINYVDAVTLSDGSVLSLGEVYSGSTSQGFVVEKRTALGVLDLNFGPNGDGTVDAGLGSIYASARADDLAVAPDGKIYVSGYFGDEVVIPGRGNKTKTERINTGRVIAFTSTGHPDTGFGTNGAFDNDGSRIKAVIPVGTASAYDLVLAYEETVTETTPATGKGKKNQGTTTHSRAMVLHMIDSDGADVSTFGTDGKVVDDISHAHEDLVNSVAVDSQGRIAIVVSQYLKQDGADPLTDVLLSRYDADGGLDLDFGTSGRVSIFDLETVEDIAIDANDAILVASHHSAGAVNSAWQAPTVERYDVNGDFDVAFDVPEIADTTNPLELDTWATDVEVDSQGRVVVGVWYGVTNWDFTAVRCLANGTRDTDFGTNGIAAVFDSYDRDQLVGLALDADDNVVVAGKRITSTTTVTDWGLLVRWLGD